MEGCLDAAGGEDHSGGGLLRYERIGLSGDGDSRSGRVAHRARVGIQWVVEFAGKVVGEDLVEVKVVGLR